ncbi:unnamed protein product [Amoebophrya sp. A25]|nr:unnamed protein product [Amoebophrya sp. A25]|eukprot:GSA25T00012053001.1
MSPTAQEVTINQKTNSMASPSACSAGPTRVEVRRVKKIGRRTMLFASLCCTLATADLPPASGCGIQPEPEHCHHKAAQSGVNALLDLLPAYDLDGTFVEYGLVTFRDARTALHSFIQTSTGIVSDPKMVNGYPRGGVGKAKKSAEEKTGNGLKWAIAIFLMTILLLLLLMSCYALLDRVQNTPGAASGGRVPVIGTDLKLERREYLRLLRLAEEHERLREECLKLQRANAALTQHQPAQQFVSLQVLDTSAEESGFYDDDEQPQSTHLSARGPGSSASEDEEQKEVYEEDLDAEIPELPEGEGQALLT